MELGAFIPSQFGKFGLEQFQILKKEILVLFLNILADGKFFGFQIDEIEKFMKIHDSSHSLLLIRDFDLFSFVKGHYLICSYTDANAPINLSVPK
jgi:hypothetical protein